MSVLYRQKVSRQKQQAHLTPPFLHPCEHSAVKDALLKMSEGIFGEHDRVALVAFESTARQLTPLAPLAVEANEAVFRRAAMELSDQGGTNFTNAITLATRILDSRTHRNPGVPQVSAVADARACACPCVSLSSHNHANTQAGRSKDDQSRPLFCFPRRRLLCRSSCSRMARTTCTA